MSRLIAVEAVATPNNVLDQRVVGLPERLFELLPAACVCDRIGLILRYNRRAAELWGRAPRLGVPAEPFCGSNRIPCVDRGPLPKATGPLAAVLRTGISVRDREVVIERPDSSEIVALVNIEALKDDDGTISGAISSFQDITARRRSEEELRTSREDLEDFVENAVVGMHWVSADGTILRANQAELDLLGYSREEYVGRHIAEFHADAATIDDIMARLARAERLDKYPARLRAKDGEIKHVLVSSSARFRDGGLVNTRCVTLDVTALERAEANRRENERRFRELLAALPAAVYTTDASGRITYYNQAAADLWGCRPGLGKNEFCGSWRLYWPDGRPMRHDECPMAVAVKEKRTIRGAEAVAERPDGTRVPFLAFPTPLFDASGALVGAVNTLVDITERQRMESAVRESEERYRTLFDSTPIAVFVCDRNAVIQQYNRRAVELWGREPARGIERHCGSAKLRLPDGTPLPHAQSPIVDVLRTGIPARNVEVSIERPDGSCLPVIVNFAALKNVRGEISGAITSFMDITERKQAEEQRTLVLREMRHRVRNLFAIASGLVAQSARGARTPGELVKSIRDRLDALARAHDMVQPGLIGAAEQTGQRMTLDALLRAILSPYLDPRCPHERTVFNGPNVRVGGNAITSLALVLHELTTNAAKYGALSSPGGSVKIDWSLEKGELMLRWQERGGPSLEGAPSHEGFGSLLARRTVTDQLGGEISHNWEPEGLIVHLSVPTERLQR